MALRFHPLLLRRQGRGRRKAASVPRWPFDFVLDDDEILTRVTLTGAKLIRNSIWLLTRLQRVRFSPLSLGSRLTAGHEALNLGVMVRIHPSKLEN